MDNNGPSTSETMVGRACCSVTKRKAKPRAASKRSRAKCAPRKRSKRSCIQRKKKVCKPGPVMNNAYLNFIREYRLKHCGLEPKELVRKAARAWCRMPDEEKEMYRPQNYRCSEELKDLCVIL
ncbi:protamine-like isoform X2 [Drosophila innubila]|uniref:protamine-like isoform X2 n=1 Tax=Drosophila innubila TaxID=198719 RepID=UPI00148CAB44|nr:protamine-like isoform X2 [Drosophila innubila]